MLVQGWTFGSRTSTGREPAKWEGGRGTLGTEFRPPRAPNTQDLRGEEGGRGGVWKAEERGGKDPEWDRQDWTTMKAGWKQAGTT